LIYVVTDADRAVLEFLAEHRFARTNQVAALLGVASGTAGRRLSRLRADGYVESDGIYFRQPNHHLISRRGLAVLHSRLPPPKLDQAAYRHDVGLAWVWLAARAGAFGSLQAIHSEREMRSEDGRAADGEERFALQAAGFGRSGGRLTHYPDLLLETAGGHRVAVELELTGKSRARLEGIMRRYVAEPRIDAVLYIVDDARVAREVRNAAVRAGAGALVHVQSARWTERVGPRQGRAPARRATPVRSPVEVSR
jgi:hypothetical protein